MKLEIAVQDAAGARAALDAGADRLELCQALGVGGLTPSLGMLESVCDRVDPDRVNVLVRPRGGGFVYDEEEIGVVEADIRASVARGVGGVVVGALTADGDVDEDTVSRWREAAGEGALVFHRAIDAVADPLAVLARLRALGVDRVLTSGGAARSIDGAETLARLVAAAGEVEIMAGGGVRVADIPALVATGVAAIHLSARTQVSGAGPAGPGGGTTAYDATDPLIVTAAVSALARPA